MATIHNCSDEDFTKEHIEKYGLSVVLLEATDYLPSFAYSVGLWEKYNHPEIICFGFSQKMLHTLINDVANVVKSGTTIATEVPYDDFLKGTDTVFVKVDPSYFDNYFGAAISYYQSRNFDALQFVWPDRNNKFPWQLEFE